MQKKETMNDVIYYFCEKYNGNWEKIYDAIKTKESITQTEFDSTIKNKKYNLVTIIDELYPNNFKEIYMPPLCIFYSGNKNLINFDSKIISLWSSNNVYEKILTNKLRTDYVYSILYDHRYKNAIKSLNDMGYKLILVSNNPTVEDFEFFKNSSNSIIISEFNPSGKKDEDVEQTIERIILGISKKSIILEENIKFYEFLSPLFSFEKRNMNVLDLNAFEKEEISKFNLKKFEYDLIN